MAAEAWRNARQSSVGAGKLLDKFYRRELDIRPGDALRCRVDFETSYGPDHEVLAERYRIVEILEVLPAHPGARGPPPAAAEQAPAQPAHELETPLPSASFGARLPHCNIHLATGFKSGHITGNGALFVGKGSMLYDAYEMQRSLLAGASTLANIGAGWLNNPANPFAYSQWGRSSPRRLDVFAHAAAPRGKPEFGIDSTIVDGKTVPVHEEIVLRKPFGQLKHFRKEGVPGGPKLLMVAPMSGHYATLLRGTVERMLPGHDVYITDWRDAKLVPLVDGQLRSRRLYRLSDRVPRA